MDDSFDPKTIIIQNKKKNNYSYIGRLFEKYKDLSYDNNEKE